MDFICKGCVGKQDKPVPTGMCFLHSNGRIATPPGCQYFFSRVNWKVN
jgi:hypothetical protein